MRLVKESSPCGHAAYCHALLRTRGAAERIICGIAEVGLPGAIRLTFGSKPGRVLGSGAVRKRDVVPVGICGIEHASDVHNVNAETLQRPVLGLRELLDDIVDSHPALPDAECLHQPRIGDRGDP